VPELVRSASLDDAYEQFIRDKLDALAGLRPRLIQDPARLPGSCILPERFTTVQQAVGTLRKNANGAVFLQGFVEEARNSGLVARLIARHRVTGISVASSEPRYSGVIAEAGGVRFRGDGPGKPPEEGTCNPARLCSFPRPGHHLLLDPLHGAAAATDQFGHLEYAVPSPKLVPDRFLDLSPNRRPTELLNPLLPISI
jgi:hypothetical protein